MRIRDVSSTGSTILQSSAGSTVQFVKYPSTGPPSTGAVLACVSGCTSTSAQLGFVAAPSTAGNLFLHAFLGGL